MNSRTEQAAVRSAELEDLLARWHAHAQGYTLNAPTSEAPSFRGVPSSRHWEYEADIADDEQSRGQMEAITAYIYASPEPRRSALQELARNLSVGANVWRSPRVPADPEARRRVLEEGVRELARSLRKAGVL